MRKVTASRDGYLSVLDAELVGRASMLLGAGRDHVDAVIDPATGIVVERKPGDRVAAKEPVFTLYYNDARHLNEAIALAERAIRITDTPPPSVPLVRAWVHADGEQQFAAAEHNAHTDVRSDRENT